MLNLLKLLEEYEQSPESELATRVNIEVARQLDFYEMRCEKNPYPTGGENRYTLYFKGCDTHTSYYQSEDEAWRKAAIPNSAGYSAIPQYTISIDTCLCLANELAGDATFELTHYPRGEKWHFEINDLLAFGKRPEIAILKWFAMFKEKPHVYQNTTAK